MTSLRYPKKMRLCSKKDIGQLLDKGTVLFKYPFKVYLYPSNEGDCSSFAISVPKRNFKHAVDRNHIKRLVRESIRQNQSIISNFKVNFLLVYISKEILDFEHVERQIKDILSESLAVVEKLCAADSGISVSATDQNL